MHQGDIESIFIDSMASMGVSVERPITPKSIEVSTDEGELRDPTSHPVKVCVHIMVQPPTHAPLDCSQKFDRCKLS